MLAPGTKARCDPSLAGLLLRGAREPILEAKAEGVVGAPEIDNMILAVLRAGDYEAADWVAANLLNSQPGLKVELGIIVERFLDEHRPYVKGFIYYSPPSGRCCRDCDPAKTRALLASEMESAMWLLRKIPLEWRERLHLVECLLCSAEELAATAAREIAPSTKCGSLLPDVDAGRYPLISAAFQKGQKTGKAQHPRLDELEGWLKRVGWALNTYSKAHGAPDPAVLKTLASDLLAAYTGAAPPSTNPAAAPPAESRPKSPPVAERVSPVKHGPASPRGAQALAKPEVAKPEASTAAPTAAAPTAAAPTAAAPTAAAPTEVQAAKSAAKARPAFDALPGYFGMPLKNYHLFRGKFEYEQGWLLWLQDHYPNMRTWGSGLNEVGISYCASTRQLTIKPWVEEQITKAAAAHDKRYVAGLLSLAVAGGGHANSLI